MKCFDLIFPRKKHSDATLNLTTKNLYANAAPVVHNGHFALLSYKQKEVKDLLFSMKYEKGSHSVFLLAEILKEFLLSEISEQNILHNVTYRFYTVPITQSRKTKDRYNHLTPLLSHVLKDITGVDAQNTMHWNRDVERQSSIKTKKGRINNVKNALSLSEPIPANSICVVIDDITTTGATLSECRDLLRKGGAYDVLTVALAH